MRVLWEPGWRDGLTVEIYHVSREAAAQTDLPTGNVLVAQAIGL